MNRSRIVTAVAALGIVASGLWYYQRADAHSVTSFRYATIARGDLESTVTSTGTLSAVRTVQVGTQVSGQVSALYVDFNDKVSKGQLLARIDPVLQQQAVAEAEAAVDRSRAQLQLAQADYERNKPLFEERMISGSEWDVVEANWVVATSNLKSSQINAEKARQNLAYTSIYAPIAGVIVSRAVDLGQTVAASMSTPELFRIAEDLTEMQILASVDESDIGKIATGQPVSFTVAAFASRSFTGEVQQVRLLSATTDNVVNYTVVISVSNVDGKLLPGMTATVKFQTAAVSDVLTVPNSALRFTPTAEMLGADSLPHTATRDSSERRISSPDSSAVPDRTRRAAGATGGSGGAASTGRVRDAAGTMSTLWVMDSLGSITPVQVRTGLTDGQRTEITGRTLAEGMRVVIGVLSAGSGTQSTTSSNPFQQQTQSGGASRSPGGF